ncbi:hypothetical protein N8I77_007012 [Diaporthe amygdali]|uniref:DUF7791 domain-containing protein n=1 Tax=Phomopsis amygdali TaxID=1214568 RepID=A0AAD9SC17_PHOAM|nr:hypothetical protein N8I77_007012 [Diaporthe amygdali]
MATMLQIALVAKEPLHMVIYGFHDLEHDDEDYWQQIPMLPFTQGEYDEIHCRMAYHLSSRTRGLLELQSFQVNFIHRTVKDYLSTEPMLGTLKQKLPDYLGRKFVPELSILRAYAAWVQRATPEVLNRESWAMYWESATRAILDGVSPGIQEVTNELMPYAAQLDSQRPRDSRSNYILDGMDVGIKFILSNARISANVTNRWVWNTKLFFRENLVEWGVCSYVFSKEMEDPVCSSMPREAKIYHKRLRAAIGRLETNQKRFTGVVRWSRGFYH